MAKTCKSCGKEYKGEYCEHCGYGNPNLKTKAADKYKTQIPVRYMTPEQKEKYYAELKKKQQERMKNGKPKSDPKAKRLLVIVAAAAVVLIFGTLFFTGVLGFNEKNTDVVEKYYNAVINLDFDKYASCFPEEMRKDYEKDLAATGYSEKEYMEAFNADFAEEYGSDFKMTYTILKAETITEYSLDGYKQAYGTVPNITEACIVATDVTFSGNGKKETYRMDCYVGKIGRHWKIFNLSYNPGTITTDMEIANPENYETAEESTDSPAESDEAEAAE